MRRTSPLTAVMALALALGTVPAGRLVPATAAPPPTALAPAQEVFARMTTAQRVGQLLMVGTPATGVSAAAAAAVANQHVGSVILTGRSTAGVTGTRAVANNLQARATTAATSGVPLVVAADQEGGKVQVLSGTGFSTMPTALTQGGWATTTLQSASTTWGRQLAAAGVNLDLAPVADTVPSAAFAPRNIPIGYYQREFGFTPATVSAHAAAFTRGMRAAGVMVSAKHFPGLGRVTANTDTTAGVTDGTTTRTDAYLAPFHDAAAAGSEFLMVSSAVYSRIDAANPAVFSSTVINGMVRSDMDYRGVVVSDDLGNARQVAAWSPGTRAVKFIAAGGDLVLTVDATQAPAMASAITTQMSASATFRSQVDAAALRVLTVKQRMGLLRPNGAVRATDLDEDGGTDLVGRVGSGRLALYRGNDRAGWRPLVPTGVSLVQPRDLLVSAGDLDGDRHADLLIRRASDGALLLYPGNGRGALGTPRVVGTGWDVMTAIVAPGDFDGDGHPDVLARDGSGRLWLYRGNGAGGWLGRTALTTGWNPYDLLVAAGDLDRDGNPDLLGRLASNHELFLLRGNGAGYFHAPILLGTGWGSFGQILGPGDVDGDGLCDVLAVSNGSIKLYAGARTSLRPGVVIGSYPAVTSFG
jgi:beta-glucosidase-like glycosyl hydrolase